MWRLSHSGSTKPAQLPIGPEEGLEFDWGQTVLSERTTQAAFPFVTANIVQGSCESSNWTVPSFAKPYVVKTVNGVRVAFTGVTTTETPIITIASATQGLCFKDPVDSVVHYYDEIMAQADMLVVLSHLGFKDGGYGYGIPVYGDQTLAAKLITAGKPIPLIIGAHSHTNPSSPEAPYKYLPALVPGPDGTPVLVNQAYRYSNTLGEVVIGLRPKTGGFEVVSRAGRYLSVTTSTPEDTSTKAIVDPYAAALATYNAKIVGQTTAPIDTLAAFTEETNGANLQADAAVAELAQHGIQVDFHLSGAMTNKRIADGATEASPVTLAISDMLAAMPYENSLVVLRMNGPQLKAVLERAYRNYYYYKYVSGYGGYSHYPTCMIDINSVGKILYRDTSPSLPDGDNVAALIVNGKSIDFADAHTTYSVSTVNYLAAGSCNFNDNGQSLWPLDQIANDTQLYVRDAVIDYVAAKGKVSPQIEGRLVFGDTDAPVITVTTPAHGETYLRWRPLKLDFSAVDAGSRVAVISAKLDGRPVRNGQVLHPYTLWPGCHRLVVTARDLYGNSVSRTVTFTVTNHPWRRWPICDHTAPCDPGHPGHHQCAAGD